MSHPIEPASQMKGIRPNVSQVRGTAAHLVPQTGLGGCPYRAHAGVISTIDRTTTKFASCESHVVFMGAALAACSHESIRAGNKPGCPVPEGGPCTPTVLTRLDSVAVVSATTQPMPILSC